MDGQVLVGTQSAFITQYGSDGSRQYTRLLGTSGVSTWATGVAVNGSGESFVAGGTLGGLGTNTLTGSGGDMFVAKYTDSGVLQ
jgi:hypothetical protein